MNNDTEMGIEIEVPELEEDERHEPLQDDAPSVQPPNSGMVLPSTGPNPYGDVVEDCCGVCLEDPGEGGLVVLWCCRNVLCVKDAQRVGCCPFCREEPVFYNIRT